MKNIFPKITVFRIISIWVIALLVFLTYPRAEYKISENIPEKIIVETWEYIYTGSRDFPFQNLQYSILDINKETFTDYTGSYDSGAILQYPESYDSVRYSRDGKFHFKFETLFNEHNQKIDPRAWMSIHYKYWTKDNRYLIATSQEFFTQFWIRFHVWQRSINVIDLHKWKTQQIKFRDTDTNRSIIEIVGAVD